MPVALFLAIAASLGIHAAALFGVDIDLSTEPESPPLVAELKPMPKSQPLVAPLKKPEKQVRVAAKPPRRKPPAPASAAPLPGTPTMPPEAEVAAPVESTPSAEAQTDAKTIVESRLPEHGRIRFRVDRGDMNFEIGVSEHDWEIADGHYRLFSAIETTGLVRIFKAYRIEMESRGLMTAQGFRPESFVIRRNGKETDEKATFDWDGMKVRVGDQAEQPLDQGAQDLLSFNYQLGFLPYPEAGGSLSIATGRKYGIYQLEVLGDEEIVVPAGTLRTLHLRAPGVNTTELWLAYEYLMLPVKIRHVDKKGDSLVQVATKIEVSPN